MHTKLFDTLLAEAMEKAKGLPSEEYVNTVCEHVSCLNQNQIRTLRKDSRVQKAFPAFCSGDKDDEESEWESAIELAISDAAISLR